METTVVDMATGEVAVAGVAEVTIMAVRTMAVVVATKTMVVATTTPRVVGMVEIIISSNNAKVGVVVHTTINKALKLFV
jgi:hypothetical protein